MTPDPSVLALAAAIRDRYIVNRRRFEFVRDGRPSSFGSDAGHMARFDGGRDSRGATHENLWLRIAHRFIEAGADMCQVIDAAFDDAAGDDKPPMPNVLMSKEALDRAADFLEDAVQAAKIDFETASRQARLAYTRYAATRPEHLVWRSVITDPAIGASPLFRFMLARSTGHADLAEKYRPAAVVQFLSRAYVYVRAIPDLPPDIAAAAKGVSA